jgi:threonine dehydrogenase-like Zn-dependent dehydrogenase
MKAIRFHGPHDFRLDELPDPRPGPGEVRIRPVAVGICGTDLHILDGTFSSRPPVILGHEVAGHVDAVGKDVRNAREGDLITVEPHR